MGSTVHIRFYAELNDFLPPGKRQVAISHSFFGRPTVKDLVESLGVPHTEIDLVLVEGRSVDFSCQVSDGDKISVYPVFEGLDVSPILRVRPEPLRETRFVLDTHLGRLAAYLRMVGFDTLYRNDYSDKVLAAISADEKRILLTRDRGLLKRSQVTHGYLVRSDKPREQLREVLHRFDLFGAIQSFCRCMRCNGILRDIAPGQVADKIPPRVRQKISAYRYCAGCGRVYWKGMHHQKMAALIDGLKAGAEKSS